MYGTRRKILQSGMSLGSLLAVGLSWHRNHSLLWAAFHAVYSWAYVAYYGLTEAEIISAPSDSSVAMLFLNLVVLIVVGMGVIIWATRPSPDAEESNAGMKNQPRHRRVD